MFNTYLGQSIRTVKQFLKSKADLNLLFAGVLLTLAIVVILLNAYIIGGLYDSALLKPHTAWLLFAASATILFISLGIGGYIYYKYQTLHTTLSSFDMLEVSFISNVHGKIIWHSPQFIKKLSLGQKIKSLHELLNHPAFNAQQQLLLQPFKTINEQNASYETTINWQEDTSTRLVHIKAQYSPDTQTILWTWIDLEHCKQSLIQEFLHQEAPHNFLQAVKSDDLFNAAPAANVLLDSSGKILHYNATFDHRFLKINKIAKGTRFIDLIVDEDQEYVLKKFVPHEDNSFAEAPFEFRLKWGSEAVAYINTFPYLSEDTGVTTQGFFLQIFNNTDQKVKQQRLAQAQKTQAIGQLAGGIAHDFNNLLTAMIGFCDLVLMRHSAGDETFKDIMQIKQNANRAANLVRQLLAFSRQQTLQPKVLNIAETLTDLSVLLQRLIDSSIQLKITQESDLGLVKVDESQFEQVIINLVVNARDAIENDGAIHVRTFNKHLSSTLSIGGEIIKEGSYVVIEVEDSGQGIHPKNLSRVFDPFFSTKEVGSGTGLGLSTVQGIINQTGGHIMVDSRLNEGTKFTIYLPQYQGEIHMNSSNIKEDASLLPPDSTGEGRILLVEDEDAVRMFSTRALRDKGYHVIEASTGEEGYNFLRTLHERQEEPVDLLITDVVMPIMDGPTLARKAHEIFPGLKIIFMSGYAQDSFREKLNNDEVHFLPKPFSLKELAEKTKEVMNRPILHIAPEPIQQNMFYQEPQ